MRKKIKCLEKKSFGLTPALSQFISPFDTKGVAFVVNLSGREGCAFLYYAHLLLLKFIKKAKGIPSKSLPLRPRENIEFKILFPFCQSQRF